MLSWAMTIHKSLRLTLPMAWIGIGKSEICAGLNFVALSWLIELNNAVLVGFPYDR